MKQCKIFYSFDIDEIEKNMNQFLGRLNDADQILSVTHSHHHVPDAQGPESGGYFTAILIFTSHKKNL